ncbi:MAG: hypothetical protein ACI4JZ_03605 [Oscillospiraceae bacterium]
MSKSMTIILLVLGNFLAYSINAAIFIALGFLPNFILIGFILCLLIAVLLGFLSSKIAVSCKKNGVDKKQFYLVSFLPTLLASIIAAIVATNILMSPTNPIGFLVVFFYAFPMFIFAAAYILTCYFCIKSLERAGKY